LTAALSALAWLVLKKIAQNATSAVTIVVATAVATVAVHSVSVAGNLLPTPDKNTSS
jgi:hypothetical protein